MKKGTKSLPIKRNYVILGDNNFWYATFTDTEKGAHKELKRVKREVEQGDYLDQEPPSSASELYLYIAEEVERVELKDY